MNEEEFVHKRKVGNTNGTLCGKDGFRTYLSNRVTCPKCIKLLDT